MKHRIYIGTLIESTHSVAELLAALGDECSRLGLLSLAQLNDVRQAILEATYEEPTEFALAILDELFTMLDAAAPEGFYFGAHVGDGADFGFWPSEDFEGEVPDFIDVEIE